MSDVVFNLLSERNETAAELSRATGISQNTISNWKKRKKGMTVENAVLVADYFGIPVADLIRKEE